MKKSIILAAGKGTRMKSELPKVVHKLCGRELINRVLDATKGAGVEEDVVIVGYKGDIVKESVDRDVVFATQTEQLGTGHAVKCALDNINDDDKVIILCGDAPLIRPETIKKVFEFNEETNSDVTVCTSVLEDPAANGRIIKDENGIVLRIVEFKDANEEERKINEINSGTYICNGKVLKDSLAKITNNNAQGEYYLTDIIEIANKDGKKVTAYAYNDPSEGRGINSPEDLKAAEEIFNSRK